MFTKKPISGSNSPRERPATGAPTAKSRWPLQAASAAWKAASVTTKSVVSSRRARPARAARAGAASSTGTLAPRNPWIAGRAKSAGSSSAGSPARRPFHHCTEASVAATLGAERCQAA